MKADKEISTSKNEVKNSLFHLEKFQHFILQLFNGSQKEN